MPGRGCLHIVAVTSSMVAPLRTNSAPPACSATCPVSKLMERSPMRCSMIFGSGVIGLLARPPRGDFGDRNWGQRRGLNAPFSPISGTRQSRCGDGPYLVVEAGSRLAAEAQPLNEGPVAGDIATCEVVQQT